MINVIAFFVGFLKAFHCKEDETLCGKTLYYDGVPVTGSVKGERNETD